MMPRYAMRAADYYDIFAMRRHYADDAMLRHDAIIFAIITP